MINFNNNTENKEEWLTPPELIGRLGVFDLDPCAPVPSTRPWSTAKNHFSIIDDGLSCSWFGRVWCNPPYGRKTFKWMRKLRQHGNGVALIFARTETVGFQEEIFGKADAILFLKGRINFFHVDGRQGGRSNAPSCLVAYGEENVSSLERSGLDGKLIVLKQESGH